MYSQTAFRGRHAALLGAVALTLGTSLPITTAHAQTAPWPSQPIKLVVGFPAGSSPDLMARTLAEPLAATSPPPLWRAPPTTTPWA